jgi:hypothetical protein
MLTDAYRELLEAWGRRPRPGTGLGQLVESIAALADGFALRAIADPERSSGEQFAPAAVTFLEALTVPDPTST